MQGRIKYTKKKVISMLMVLLTLITIMSPSYQVSAKKVYEDPAVGTASDEIENMIALGKGLIGNTPYVWGGGHSDWNKQKDKEIPDGLDCSSFIAWAMYNGMGIDLGLAPTSGNFKNYLEKVDYGSMDKAQRGDLVAGTGHIEIYLGQDDDGNHLSLHAANSDTDILITKTHWGQGVGSKDILRINLQDAKDGKNGMKYDPSLIKEAGVSGTGSSSSGSQSGNSSAGGGNFSEEDLFRWLDPIVDFSGTSNTHSESEERDSSIKSKTKGLKGNKKGFLDSMFGTMDK